MPDSTPATAAAPTPHLSFLKRVGQLGLECLERALPIATKTAQAAEPLVDLLFPLQGGLFTTVVNTVCLTEVQGTEAAKAANGGEQKFQAVFATVGPELLEMAHNHGLMGDDADAAVKQYIQAIVDLLNGPAKATTTPSS